MTITADAYRDRIRAALLRYTAKRNSGERHRRADASQQGGGRDLGAEQHDRHRAVAETGAESAPKSGGHDA